MPADPLPGYSTRYEPPNIFEVRNMPVLRFEQLMTGLIVTLTVLVSAFSMSPSVADPDLWGHIQFGRQFLETGQLEETTSFSFTAEGYRWINHENLSEIVMAWTVDHLGVAGLLWGKLMLSLFVIGSILYFNFRAGVGLIANCVLTIFVASNLGYHWSFRPQLSSFCFFTLLVILLQVSFTGWRDNWHLKWFQPRWLTRGEPKNDIDYSWFHARLLWLSPLLFVLWANSHGGFVAGVCIFVVYLGCRAAEALSTFWPKGWGLVRRMSLMILVGVLATLLNPYSYRLPAWLLQSLGTPRPEIMDWSSSQLYSLVGLKFWGLIALVIFALAYSKRSLDFTQCVLLGLTLWQSFSHFRHVPFFAILAGFWLGPHLQSALFRLSSPALVKPGPPQKATLGHLAMGVAMVLMVGIIGYQLTQRLSTLRVERNEFPVDAFEFMSENRLGGRLVVTYDWAQYAIAAFCVEENLRPGQPISTVAFDGRFRTCYPQEIVDMHFDLLFGDQTERARSSHSLPIDPTRVLRHGDPELVLIKRGGELSERVMNAQSDDWVLLYQDRLAQLWGRREKYDNSSRPDYVASSRRIIRTDLPRGYEDWPALPIKLKPVGLPGQLVNLMTD